MMMRRPKSLKPWGLALLAVAIAGGSVPARAADIPPNVVIGGAEAAETTPPPAEKQFRMKSLFFPPDDIEAIRDAVTTYETRRNAPPEEKPVRERRRTERAARFFTYPQFFLASLVYHSAGDWIIQINGQRMTTDSGKDKDADLRVVTIDKDKVTCEWKMGEAAPKVLEVWEHAPNDAVKVDKEQGTVTFTLRMNQTFSTYVMRTLEGKQQPVTIATRNEAAAADTENSEEGEDLLRSLVSPPGNADGKRTPGSGMLPPPPPGIGTPPPIGMEGDPSVPPDLNSMRGSPPSAAKKAAAP